MPKDWAGGNNERGGGTEEKEETKEERRNGCRRPSVCEVPHISGVTVMGKLGPVSESSGDLSEVTELV